MGELEILIKVTTQIGVKGTITRLDTCIFVNLSFVLIYFLAKSLLILPAFGALIVKLGYSAHVCSLRLDGIAGVAVALKRPREAI